MNGIQELMAKIKRLQEFEVQVTVPENFRFTGPVPFDMNIIGDQAFVRLVASDIDEARTRAESFFTYNQDV